MRKVTAAEWIYLLVSVAASYYLVQMQRGNDADMEVRFWWTAVKIIRTMRLKLAFMEASAMTRADAALERVRYAD